MKKLVLAASAAGLTACASTYQVPVEEAPPEWRDDGTKLTLTAVDGTAEAFGGDVMSKGDVLLQFEVENLRTGIIEDAVSWKSPYGVEQSLPAGTPVYARQFSLSMQRTYNYVPTGPARNLNALNNPIEWCAPRENDAVCIFWEGPEKARYIASSGAVPQSVSLTSANGMEGPVPTIIEQEVEFDRPLEARYLITRINDKEMRLMGRLYEGDDWASFGGGTQRIPWDRDTSKPYNLFSAKYEFQPIYTVGEGIESVTVKVVEQPTDVKLMTLGDALALIRAVKAAQELAAEADTEEAVTGEEDTSADATPDASEE